MPKFKITDPETGRVINIIGDSPPTEQELVELFASQAVAQPAQQKSRGRSTAAPPVKEDIFAGLPQDIADRIRAETARNPSKRSPSPINVDTARKMAELEKIRLINPGLANLIEETGGLEALAIGAGQGVTTLGRGVGLAEPASEAETAAFEGLRSQQPVAVGAGKFAAEAAPFLVPGAGAARIASVPGRLAASSALGAAEGGIVASGEGRDPLTGAIIGAVAGAAPVVPAAQKSIRNFIRAAPTEEAARVLSAGKKAGVPVLTTDLVPPETFFGKSIQQMGEKIGFLGTGQTRVAQQKARQEAVQGLADEFGITSVSDSSLPKIIDSLTSKQAKELAAAATQRNGAVARLNTFGDVPTNTTTAEINRQIARQEKLGAKGNADLIANLNDIKSSIAGDFGQVKDIRTEVISDLKALARSEDARATGAVQSVKSAIDKDLAIFARKSDKPALKDWLASNRKFSFELGKAKNTELKRLIQSGDASPKVVGPILRGGDAVELNRLNSSLTPSGQKAARTAIIKDALDGSDFFNSANPDRLATILNKPKNKRAIDVFFKGDDKKQLDGLVRLLDSTRRAQQASVSTATGQQLIPVAATGGLIAEPMTAFLTGGTLAAVTRGYESKAVRNILLKLQAAKRGSAEEASLIRQLSPAVNAAIPIIEEQ